MVALIGALCIGTYAFMNRATGTNNAAKTTQLILVPFSYFESDEGGGLHFYQVSTTSNQSISPALIEKMNAALATDYCGFGRPGQPHYRTNLLEVLASWKPREDLRTWDAERLRQALITEYHYEHSSKQVVVHNQNGLLSIAQESWDFCAGAHPNSLSTGFTFNTQTGGVLEFPDLFTNFRRDRKEIAHIVNDTYTGSLKADPTDPDQECRDFVNENMHSGGDLEYTAFTLTSEGVRLQSLGFPHWFQVCEPHGDITIPYTKLSAYMKESILSAVEPVIRD